MYRVSIKNKPTDDWLVIHSEIEGPPKVVGKGLKIGINVINSFSFEISPANPGYGKIKPLTTLIEVRDTKTDIAVFEGRVLSPDEDMDATGGIALSYLCESELGYLHDSIQPFRKVQNTSPKALLELLITEHNKQVEPYKRFKVGDVTVTNTTDNVYRYIDDTGTTFTNILEKLVNRDSLGGELQVRKVKGELYLDWLTAIGGKSKTKIELQRNLISMSKKLDVDNVVTRLTPRGARVEVEGNTDASQPRLTIASVNGGKDYIDGPDALIAEFGIQGGSETWDDVNKPDILLKKAKDWLNSQIIAIGGYQVKAVDLSLLGLDPDTYRIGWEYEVINQVLQVEDWLRITEVSLDINDPVKSSFNLGEKKMKLSQYQAKAKKYAVELDGLRAEMQAQQQRMGQMTKLLNDADEAIKKLKDDIVAGSGTVNSQIDEILKKLNEISNNMPSIETVNSNTQRIAELESKVRDLDNRNRNLEQRVQALENK